MKKLSQVVAALSLCGAASLFADTVTINPGSGKETNVIARLTGETSVAVNTGATGGGIVRLNSANSYSGGTTLDSGTLVVKSGEGAKGFSDIGTGDVTLGAATLKYVGPAGGVLDKTVTSTFAAKATKSCVLDVQNDLVVTENWKQNYGSFIKTGPGTVVFRGKQNFFGARASGTADTLSDTAHKLTFNANGDGPTTGVRGGFVLAEGTMVIEGDETTTNYLSGSTSLGAIGTWTVDSGKEKSAVLEIRGGQNFMPKAAIPGYHNGNATTGGEGVSSGIRMTGGYLQVGKDPSVAKDETFFFGGSSTPSGYKQNSHPFIEVTGGKMVVSKNIQLGNQGGVHTRLTVAGDGELEIGQYIGNGYSGTPVDNPASNSLTIAGNGTLTAQYITIATKASNSVCDVSILDNGRYLWTVTNNPAIRKESSSATGKMNVLMDGGGIYNTWTKFNDKVTLTVFHTSVDKVEIGTRGAKFGITKAQQRFNYKLPFVYRETRPGEERQPVEFLGLTDQKTFHQLDNGFSWDGPVRVGPFGYIYVNAEAGVNFSKLVHCRDARIVSNVKDLVVGDYQIGEKGVTGSQATLFLTTATSVQVTGKLTVPSTTRLHVYMRKTGAKWTDGGVDFTTPGDYLVLTVPAASREALEAVCAKATYATSDKCASSFHVVGNPDGTFSLKLKILEDKTLNVVGETIVVASLGVGKGYEKVEIGAGGTLVVQGDSTLSSADAALEVHVTDGGLLVQNEDIAGHTTTTPYAPSFYIDGGIVACPWAGNGGAAKYLRYANFYVGAKGAIFDASLSEAAGGLVGGQYLHVGGTWAKDPALGDAPDGGITFRGHGLHYLGGTFKSTLQGDFTVTDHAQLMAITEALVNSRVVVKPGCGFRSYESQDNPVTTVGSLVLGEAGAVEPVVLSAFNKQVNVPGLSYLIVKGEFSVLSPVYYGVRSVWTGHAVTLDAGTYNVVFYKEGNVDASLFQADPSISGKKVTFEVQDVTEGDYAGYKAVVATVVQESGASAPLVAQRWTANAAGGNWSDAANWENGQKPGFAAEMASPLAAAVPVALDERPYLRQLTVEGDDAEKGYVFGGANGLFFEAGALSDITKRFETFQSDVKVDVPVKVEGPIVVANRAGSTVEFAKGLSGSGAVNVNDRSGSARGVSGEVVFGEGTEAGQLKVGTGRVTIGSLGWAKKAADVVINRGTLHYTGSGETIPGVTFTNSPSCGAVIEIDRDLAVMSLPAASKGPFLKMGAGTLRFTGNGTFICGQNNMMSAPSNETDSVVLPNGDGPINTLANFSVAQGKVIIGTVGDPNDAPNAVVSSQMAVGLHAGEGASPELVLNNGSLTISKNALRIGYYDTLGDRMTTPKVTVNGGVFTIGDGPSMNATNLNMPEPYGNVVQNASPTLDVNGGEVIVKGSTRLGYCVINPAFPDQASTINVNGGAFTTGGLVMGNYDAAAGKKAVASYLNLNGGVTTVTNELNLNRNADGTSVVTLNAGAALKVGSIVSTRAGGKLVFNGGTLFITGAGSDDKKGEYLVGAKGAVISTAEAENGQATFTVVLKHDPSLGDNPDGGLVKKGPGALVLSPDSTFTGPIVVEEGVIIKGGGAKIDASGDVVLPAGAVISCFGEPNEWNAGVGAVGGNLSAEGPIYVDFGRTAKNPIKLGERYPLLVLGGEVKGNLRMRAVNAGANLQLATVVEDGVLYAEVIVRGMIMMIR